MRDAVAALPDVTAVEVEAVGPALAVLRATPTASVAEGLQRTGGIVTAGALVIGVVITGFIFGGFAPVKAVGLGLVLAIALDATIVQILLVPATLTLLGRRN